MRKFSWKIGVTALVMSFMAAAAPASAMEATLLAKGLPLEVQLSGEIKSGDAAQIISALKAALPDWPEVDTKVSLYDERQLLWVEINSPGGDLTEAMTIGRCLRHMDALIAVDGPCLSACVLVLAGAVERVQLDAVPARIGVHRPYIATIASDVDIAELFETTRTKVTDYFREMRISLVLADRMFATPPEELDFLSAADLKMLLPRLDPVWDEVTTVRRASIYRVSPAAYRQHQITAGQNCGAARVVNTDNRAVLMSSSCKSGDTLGIPIGITEAGEAFFNGTCSRPPNFVTMIGAGNSDFLNCAHRPEK